MSRQPNFVGWGFGPALTGVIILAAIVIAFTSGDDEPPDPPPWNRPGASEGIAGQRTGRGTVIGRGASEAGGAGEVASDACGAPEGTTAAAGGQGAPVAGAEPIGGGGGTDPSEAPPTTLECLRLDDLDLGAATALATDADGSVWLLVPGPGDGGPPRRLGFGDARLLRSRDGRIDLVRDADGPGWLSTVGGGDVSVVARGDDSVSVLGPEPERDRRIDVDLVGAVFALAVTDDGTVLAARRRAIETYGLEGEPGDEIPLDATEGQVAALVALPGDRAAFVMTQTDESADSPLYLATGEEVRNVDIDPQDGDREIVALAMGPGDRLLAVAAGADTHPRILAVDVDSGATETVADLKDALPHPEGPGGTPGALWPVAATADGHDLLLLADGRLWRLEDAFG